MESIIELKNIRKTYGDHVVLDDFNLSVEKGKMVALVGKSGSGKTTVLNIMGLLEKPDSGTVIVCGNTNVLPNSAKSVSILRNKIGYLFQNFALIDNETIGDNLEIPLIYSKKGKPGKDKLKKEALIRVGLSNSLNQKVSELSGGEQQRVSIARILLKPCEIILADEPTGSLDKENGNKVLELLKTLNKEGKTVVIVTHDLYVSDLCDVTITLS
jgi:putative bacteriocin export ABC transporter, lactococcin 972 group